MKQNAIKKIPVTIIGIINSTKNSNIAITFNFRIKKNRRSSQTAGSKRCKSYKTNLSKQVTIYFLERLNFFFLFDRCSTEEEV